jgi:hypothetical protein
MESQPSAGPAGRNGEEATPGPVPPVVDERDALLSFLSQQRDAIRYAAHGLTDEQAMARPSVSELTLAGLVKHVALCEQGWMVSFVQEGSTDHFFATDDYVRGFALADGETLADVLSLYADVAVETEKIVTDLPDLGAPLTPTPTGIPLAAGRPGLLTALGVIPPDRGDGPARRPCRHHPRVPRRRHLLGPDGGRGGLGHLGVGITPRELLRGNNPTSWAFDRVCR